MFLVISFQKIYFRRVFFDLVLKEITTSGMIPSYEITSIVYIYIYILDSKDRIQSDDIHYESMSVRSKP